MVHSDQAAKIGLVINTETFHEPIITENGGTKMEVEESWDKSLIVRIGGLNVYSRWVYSVDAGADF